MIELFIKFPGLRSQFDKFSNSHEPFEVRWVDRLHFAVERLLPYVTKRTS